MSYISSGGLCEFGIDDLSIESSLFGGTRKFAAHRVYASDWPSLHSMLGGADNNTFSSSMLADKNNHRRVLLSLRTCADGTSSGTPPLRETAQDSWDVLSGTLSAWGMKRLSTTTNGASTATQIPLSSVSGLGTTGYCQVPASSGLSAWWTYHFTGVSGNTLTGVTAVGGAPSASTIAGGTSVKVSSTGSGLSIAGGDRDLDLQNVAEALINFGWFVDLCFDHEMYIWSQKQRDIQGSGTGNMRDVAWTKGYGGGFVAANQHAWSTIRNHMIAIGATAAQMAKIRAVICTESGQFLHSAEQSFWQNTDGVNPDSTDLSTYIDYVAMDWYSRTGANGDCDYGTPANGNGGSGNCLSFPEAVQNIGVSGDNARTWLKGINKNYAIWEWGCENSSGAAAQGNWISNPGGVISGTGTAGAAPIYQGIREALETFGNADNIGCENVAYFFSSSPARQFAVTDAAGQKFLAMANDAFFQGTPSVTLVPTSLKFKVQPSNTQQGQTMTPAVKVQVLDQNGNLLTSDNSSQISLQIGNNPGVPPGTLTGGGSVTVVGGVATFPGLSIDNVANGYTLQAVDHTEALPVITSAAFNITATVQPPGAGSVSPYTLLPGAVANKLERVLWYIDDSPVPMDWDEATSIAPGGYESCSGTVPMRFMPDGAGEGSIVLAVRESGKVLWYGSVAQTPKLRDGVCKITGEGPMQRLARNVSRLPYQLRGGSLWQLRDGTPFNEPKNNKNIGLTGGGGHSALVMKLNNGIAYTNGDSGGWCLWVQGWPALRIGFTMKKAVDDNNFAFELNTGNGPSGALTQEHTFTWGAGNPDGSQKDYTITAQNLNDLLEVGLVCTGNNTPSNPEKFAVSDIRVNCIDTTSDDGDWDTFWTSEVVADVFRRAGIDDSFVEHSGVNALPLDWTGAWTDLCTQMMEMDDWVWGVIEPPTGSHAFGGGFYRPWGDGGDRLWTVTLGAGGDESLDYLPLYNRVSVQYECPPGVDQTYTLDASPDPLAGTRAGGSVREWPEPIQLPDPTPDGALAQLVAQIWINKVSSLRAIGEVTFARVFSESGERSPYDVLAGDLCSVAELAASTPFGGQGLPPQRIVSTRYTPTEVTAEFEDSLDPSTLILEAEGRHPHRHHGQHHRRRHH